jgi:hypothetical protein
MQQATPHTTRTLPKRRKKAPLEVDLIGHVGELVAAEFAKSRMERGQDREQAHRIEELLLQILEQNRLPIKAYTENDFEAMFGLKQRAQQDYRKKGKLDCIKLGEKVLYTLEHIHEFKARFDTRNQKKT